MNNSDDGRCVCTAHGRCIRRAPEPDGVCEGCRDHCCRYASGAVYRLRPAEPAGVVDSLPPLHTVRIPPHGG